MLVIFFVLKRRKKTNLLLTEKNTELHIVSEEIKTQNEEILAQKENIEEKNKKLELLNTTKNKLFAIIGHDLRNPFSSIIGLSQLLISNFKNYDNEKKLTFLNYINTASEDGHNLLVQLLDWARVQTGVLVAKPTKFTFKSIFEQTINVLEPQVSQKEISISSEFQENLELLSDKNMISTVLRNLITNAIKFTHKGGYIKIKALAKQDFIEISVSDNGIGISSGRLKKLFSLSESSSSSGTEHEKGTGLGLILCKDFIDLNGGTIKAESQEGKGSTFTFILPK